MRLLAILLLFFCIFIIKAQTSYTLSGTITDLESGETLSGANLTIREIQGKGVSCNDYGYYSMSLPKGTYLIKVSYLGYELLEHIVTINRNTSHNFKLIPQAQTLSEFRVSAFRKNNNIMQEKSGFENLKIRQIKNIPVMFGEQDILKTISLTPGVKSIGEGDGNLYIRGGKNSHNMILLDEATVYNANHLLGFFSTFNSDAIKDLTLYKGTAPADYGGRLASVMDIKMNEGNNKEFRVGGGIGLISSRLAVEGPIVQNRGSFLISGRRTYADLFLKLFADEQVSNNQLYFHDLNLKMNYSIDDNNRIFVSGYLGRDVLGVTNHFAINWGNKTSTIRWARIWNGKLFSNTSVIYSDYDYKVDFFIAPTKFGITSGINSMNLKHEFQYYLNNKHTYTFGYNGIWHNVLPGQLNADEDAHFHPLKLEKRFGLEQALYWSNEYKPASKWNINYGIRLSMFQLLGPGEFYTYANGQVVDTTSFASGKTVKSYFFAEPRINAVYVINQEQSVKFSYTRNTQNIHTISNSTGSVPTDIWLMSGNNIAPEISDQLSTGYYHNFKDDIYQFSTELYYKWLQNQIDLKNGADIRANQHVEGELLFGKGRAYGFEMMMRKKYGDLNGWVSYTLSRTELSIPGINAGNWYPARQDATHDLSIVAIYNLSKSFSLSGVWVYQTGNAVTFPSGKYELDGEIKFYYTNRNSHRMPDYHRLDLGTTWNFKQRKNYRSSLNFSIYNVYARKNAFSIDFEQDPNNPDQTRSVMTYLFTIMPSMTYNFKF
ncbi:MAG: TonB-dependent receptor [Paludibacter sp.]|nr:TonB-dependent receptor [Paludibacter sp.]